MKYIVVTDLDGTLLDHQTYDYAPALNAIAELGKQEIPIILNSSKTQAEISALCQQLGNHEPFVCENGGVLVGMGEVKHLGTPREQFLPSLRSLKEKLRLQYQGFAEATVDDVVQWTGLTPDDAQKAMARSATEPLLWQDTDLALEKFRQQLQGLNLQFVKGGRFHHVMGIFNKASCFPQLKEYYAQSKSEEVKIIALGDSPNDLPMLEQADYAIVVPSGKSNQLKLNNPATYYAIQPAPHGWQEGITEFLHNYRTGKPTFAPN